MHTPEGRCFLLDSTLNAEYLCTGYITTLGVEAAYRRRGLGKYEFFLVTTDSLNVRCLLIKCGCEANTGWQRVSQQHNFVVFPYVDSPVPVTLHVKADNHAAIKMYRAV